MAENKNERESRQDSASAAALTVGEESASAAAAPRKDRRASRIVAWCVVALAAVAIVVCGWGIASPLLSQDSAQEQPQEAASVQGDAAGEGASSEFAASQDASGKDSAGDDERNAGDDSAKNEPSVSSSSSSGASDSNVSQASGGASGAAASSGGGFSSGSNASASGGASGSSGSGSQSGASSGQASAPNTVTVSVAIDSSAAGSPVSLSTTLTFQQGATVYDALVGSGVAVGASQTAYGVYVASIGGLAEKQHGPMSGWTYYVNGAFINTACSNYVLSDGDSILWTYVNVTE